MVKKRYQSHHWRSAVTGTLSALGFLAVSSQLASANQVTVKPGDTVWGIAQQHKLTVQSIEQANPTTIKKISSTVDLIQVGQKLTLPDGATAVQTSSTTPAAYTVQSGDTLNGIAQQFNVSADQLMAWNQLNGQPIQVGQQLTIKSAQPLNEQANNNQGTVANNSNEGQPVAKQSTDQAAPVTSSVTSATPRQNNFTAASQTTAAGNVAQTSEQFAAAQATVQASQQPVSTITNAAPKQTQPETTATNATQASQVGVVSQAQNNVTLPTQQPGVANNNYVQGTNQQFTQQTPVSSAPNTVASQQPAASTAPATNSTTQPAANQAPATNSTTQPAASQAPATNSTTQPAANQAPATNPTTQPAANQAPTAQQPANTNQQTPTASANDLQNGSVVSLAVKIANSNSVPYVWGGNSLNGMDCSGFVDYVYAHAENKQLPHNSTALESYVNQHAVSEAQPGDLLFWGSHGSSYHVAIYTGNNQYAAAAKPGTNVSIYTLSPYFAPSFAGTVK